MEVDSVGYATMRELMQRARAVGISMDEGRLPEEFNTPATLEAEIERRINERSGVGWAGKMAAFAVRRKRLAAAYLTGASLTQLATLERVSPKTVHDLVTKELPTELRLRLAAERTARGRRRAPAWTPTQVSAIMGAVRDTDVKSLPIITIAARMLKAATTTSETDESDPYLRGDPEAETTSHLPGQDGRGDGAGSEEVRPERAAEGDS